MDNPGLLLRTVFLGCDTTAAGLCAIKNQVSLHIHGGITEQENEELLVDYHIRKPDSAPLLLHGAVDRLFDVWLAKRK
ncbi:hypothetical protein D9M70_589920 [compost metagenome]